MICERCGGENPEDVSFCRRCGHQVGRGPAPQPPPSALRAPVPRVISCPRCGAENPADLRYCSTCGTTLPKRETPTHPEGEQRAVPQTTVASATTAGGSSTSAPSSAAGPTASAPSTGVPSTGAPSTAGARLAATPSARPEPRVEEDRKNCPKCGAALVPGAAFCQACGANVRSFNPPAPRNVPPPAKLVVIAQDGTPGRRYPITDGRVDVGREQGEVLLAVDPYTCPRHARIIWKNGQFWVVDLGSVNGVFARLNAPERLVHGDTILVGLEVFRFEQVSALETNREPAYERGTRLFGSPAVPRYARLVQRTVEGVSSNVFYLSKNQSTIGRETGDFVFVDDAFMSRQHATFTRQQDGSFLLTDLGSSNGTFIAIRDERPLPDGGHVRIGQHLFRLEIES